MAYWPETKSIYGLLISSLLYSLEIQWMFISGVVLVYDNNDDEDDKPSVNYHQQPQPTIANTLSQL